MLIALTIQYSEAFLDEVVLLQVPVAVLSRSAKGELMEERVAQPTDGEQQRGVLVLERNVWCRYGGEEDVNEAIRVSLSSVFSFRLKRHTTENVVHRMRVGRAGGPCT